ncbi:non-homologous end joining protein Ku [Hydrogenophaga laconesensis]|uniref:Non-homologous end joining protein Ku n=1 Tax=Hydrogenophaga laconesensis TaxID=1805971 RepID=A0ABU1V878_9BURK|nr:Ku protein [Hydrogenophaga laconesensis]MDR7093617.1 DNA end-binding protein Ku [Hydrogenophaga laconesensis]
MSTASIRSRTGSPRSGQDESAPDRPRVIWKGAISFGLVHVPVALYPASQDNGIDFDWLDKRSMDPVGYQRINKRTGKPVKNSDIVKGVQQDDGEYVILSEAQIKAAYPAATQTIEIETFVQAAEIPFLLLEKPYYLEPVGKGDKVYALLREAMLESGVIGISRVILHTREHLAALIPMGPALVLNTIRWASEIRPVDGLRLPAAGKAAAGVKAAELKMATQLIGEMTRSWDPEAYEDRFVDAVQALVRRKVKAGDTKTVKPVAEAPASAAPSNVVDLTELLARSLAGRQGEVGTGGGAAVRPARRTRNSPSTARKRA